MLYEVALSNLNFLSLFETNVLFILSGSHKGYMYVVLIQTTYFVCSDLTVTAMHNQILMIAVTLNISKTEKLLQADIAK